MGTAFKGATADFVDPKGMGKMCKKGIDLMIVRIIFSIHVQDALRVILPDVEFNQASTLMSAAFAACHEPITGYKLIAIRKHWLI